jgi:hypothetical protein
MDFIQCSISLQFITSLFTNHIVGHIVVVCINSYVSICVPEELCRLLHVYVFVNVCISRLVSVRA